MSVFNIGHPQAFHWRTPEPTADDFDETTLTDDVLWHDLDLSSIIPPDATAILVFVKVQDNVANSHVHFRRSDQSAEFQMTETCTQVGNQIHNNTFTCGVIGQKVSVQCVPKPTDFTFIDIIILGWWL